MAERYSRIYTLPGSLYSENSLVLIVAGALLKDNQTGKMLAQLKIQNLDKSVVTGMTLSLVLFDAEGNQIGNPFEHQFSRISVEEDSYFGQKDPIILPAGEIHSYQVSVKNVGLYDGTVWEPVKDWYTLPADTSISDIKQNISVLRQKKAEENQRELEELEQRKKKQREEQEAVKQKRKKKAVIIVASVLLVLIAVFCLFNSMMDSRTKKDLLPELLSSTWQYHKYYVDDDWDFTFTLTFVDEATMTYVSEVAHKNSQEAPDKEEYECTWEISSISSDKANISARRSDGKTYMFTVYFETKNGELDISKMVDSQYTDNVYYRK